MAQSRRATKKVAKAKLSEAKPGCPKIRLPWERSRVSISFDPDEDLTHQSFKDECDINNIIDLHTRTGIVNHLNRGTPQYGFVPSSSMFEAACAQAAIRSAEAEGFEPSEPDKPEAEAEESEPARQEASQEASGQPPEDASEG